MFVPFPPRDNPRAIRAALYEHVARSLSGLPDALPAARLVRCLDRLSTVRIVGCLGVSPVDTLRNLRAAEAEGEAR